MAPDALIAWREALGGRRFLMTMGAGVIDALLLYVDKLDASSYVTLTLGTVAAYIAAGTTEKVKINATQPPPQ